MAANRGLTVTVPAVSSIVVDPSRGSAVFAITVDRALFKSTDHGSTWTTLDGISGVLTAAVDPSSPATVYAGTFRGIRKSSDGGVTWTTPALPDRMIRTIAIDPVTPTTVYTATDEPSVFKSTDAGATWTEYPI